MHSCILTTSIFAEPSAEPFQLPNRRYVGGLQSGATTTAGAVARYSIRTAPGGVSVSAYPGGNVAYGGAPGGNGSPGNVIITFDPATPAPSTRPPTAQPTSSPTASTTTTITATTHTALQDTRRDVNTLMSQQQSMIVATESQLQSMTAAQLSTAAVTASTIASLRSQLEMQQTQIAAVVSAGRTAASMIPPVQADTADGSQCPPTAEGIPSTCNPTIQALDNGNVVLQTGAAGRVLLNTGSCGSVDPCALRQVVRQLVSAVQNLTRV